MRETNGYWYSAYRRDLYADCQQCFGLCCAALYFSTMDGFPQDKMPGVPCRNLSEDFRCNIHGDLWNRGLKGCISFDCFGAGQKVAQVSFAGRDWIKDTESAGQMFEVFLVMRHIHELLWYMADALSLPATKSIHDELSQKFEEILQITTLSPESLLELDIVSLRESVNQLLLKTSELVRADVWSKERTRPKKRKSYRRGADLLGADLRREDLTGANFRGACLIGANLSGNTLKGADVIGADFRDADIRRADLSEVVFLTQAQLNAAKGDRHTKIPKTLAPPNHWML